MSNVIDQKVVEMRFDNKQFEANVATTQSSIEKLKKSLNFKETSKELENFSYTVGFSLQDIKNKMWSLLEYDIAGKLKNQIVSITKALTLTPITTGFNEYELKMGSIQTIMASTGESLETVNSYLGELNEYSDKTIYSFQDMTSNIGKFTNAGVNLEDSVAAIKGVSNVAAVSGANANEASRAMYNFAQALSAGYVKLIDWKSIENANMATVEFKNQLLEAAVAEGKLTKTSDGMYKTLKGTTISATKNFNDSLQEQWMTSEVLIGTLKKYADETTEIGKKATQAATEVKTLTQLYDTLKESAQSGWAQTWEIIVGDFEEAKKFLAELNELIGGLIDRSAKARNELLENWKVLGGREELIEAFRALVDVITSVVKPIKEAWQEIFSPLTSEGLYNFTVGLKEFFQSLILTDNAADNLRRVFKGLFSLLSIGVEIFKGLWEALGFASDGATDLGGGLLEVLAIIGDMLTAVADFIKETKIIRNIFLVIGKAIKLVLTLAGKLITAFTGAFEARPLEIFNSMLEGLAKMLDSMCDSAGDFGESFKDTIKSIGRVLESSVFFRFISSLWNGAKSFVSGIISTVGSIFKGIGRALSAGDLTSAFEIISKLLDGGLIAGLIVLIKKLIDLLNFGGLIDAVKDICDSVSEYIGSLSKSIKAEALYSIAKAVGILAAALVVLAFIPKDKLEKSLAAITIAFGELLLMFTIISKLGIGTKFDGLKKSLAETFSSNGTLITMIIGLIAMTWALKQMGDMNWDQLVRGCTGIVILLGAMTGVMWAMSKFATVSKVSSTFISPFFSASGVTKFTNPIKGLTTIAFALLIMSVPFKIIGSMPWDEWGRGVMGLTVLMAAMTATVTLIAKFANGAGKSVLAGTGAMMLMATALLLMAAPFAVIGVLPWDVWGRGLIGVVSLLTVMTAAVILIGKIAEKTGKTMLAGAGAIAIMAATLQLLVPPLVILGMLPTEILIQGAIALGGILAALTIAALLLVGIGKIGKTMLAGAGSVAIMAASIWTIIPAVMLLGYMPIDALKQGCIALVSVVASLTLAAIGLSALGKIGKTMLAGAGSVAIMAASIGMIIPSLLILGMMPTEKVIQGCVALGVIVAELGAAIVLMSRIGGIGSGMILAATSFAIMAASLNLLVPALLALSLIPGILLAKSLGAVAIAMAIFVAACKGLSTVAGPLIAVGTAVALFGAGIVGVGAGLVLIGVGLKVLSVGLLAFLGVLTLVVAEAGLVIVGLIKIFEVTLVAILDLLIAAVPKLAKLITALIFAICDILIDNVPKLVDMVLIIITELCRSLAEYTPDIVASLMDLLIGVIEALVGKLPDLIAAFKMDKKTLAGIIETLLMLDAIMKICASFALLGVLALAGLALVSATLTSLSLVLAGAGALYKIPGLSDLIADGGEFLRVVGIAIGSFVGGIVGGIAAGAASSLPFIGECLSGFMNNASDFLDGASRLDSSSMDGVKSLLGVLVGFIGAGILDNLLPKFLTGGSSLVSFGKQLAEFGPSMAEYADSVSGIDANAVKASAEAAKSLTSLAHSLPNTGGLWQALAGENDLEAFGDALIAFGQGLKGFSDEVGGVDATAISNVVPAAKSLVEIAKIIPNTGGLVAAFSGDNTMDVFGSQLAGFGRGIKSFATSVAGLSDDGSISTAISVAKSLVTLSNNIPNEGGLLAWITGENSIANFAWDLVKLGTGIKDFATEVTGIDSEAVVAAANAGKVIAEMTNTIPNEGGIVAWFTGENSIAAFADSLPVLGEGLSGFASSTAGITVETISAAAHACKTLAEMTNSIPNEGGVTAWFSGESSISKFGNDLISLGQGIKGFAEATIGINPESATSAANVCKTLAEMTTHIPNEGGVMAWFSGESAVSKFATDLTALGKGIKGFSDETVGVNPETVKAAAEAAKGIASMVGVIPPEGGIKAWFAGESSVSKFAGDIPKLGKGLAGFSEAVVDINGEKVTAGANAAKSIAEMTKIIPTEGGMKAWFAGEKSMSKFAGNLPDLGKGIKGFSDEVADINPENVKAGATAAKTLAQMAETAPKDSKKIISFGDNLKSFGTKLKEYFNNTKDITAESVSNASKALDEVKEIANVNSGNIKAVASAIKELTKAIKQMATDIKDDLKKAGKEAIEAFIDGIDGKLEDAKGACSDILDGCADAIGAEKTEFESAGKNLVNGFINGIDLKKYAAANAARAMASAAAEAAKNELKEHSPSRVGVEIGDYFGIGFVNGIAENVDKAYGASKDMAKSARNGLSDAISKVSDAINSDIDTQPTIRPVLDLSDIRTGAGLINGMFGNSAIGINANAGVLSSVMSRQNQNGTTDDVISAINNLRKDLNNMETASYTIGNVNFSGDAEVEEAFNTIIRAVNMARRT